MLYLPASNYGADYVFCEGAEYFGQFTDKWIPDTKIPGLGLIVKFARIGLCNAVPFVLDAQTESWEEYFQEYFKQEALRDVHDSNILVDAFGMGMFDAAAYSIIGYLLRLGIRGGAAGIWLLTPQGRANAQAQKLLQQNLAKISSNIQDIQTLAQQIQQRNSILMMSFIMTQSYLSHAPNLMRILLWLWA